MNVLGEPKKAFADTFSAMTTIKEHFSPAGGTVDAAASKTVDQAVAGSSSLPPGTNTEDDETYYLVLTDEQPDWGVRKDTMDLAKNTFDGRRAAFPEKTHRIVTARVTYQDTVIHWPIATDD